MWMEVYAKPKVKRKTYESYLGVVKQLMAIGGDKKIAELRNSDCQLFLNRLYDNGMAKSTINTAKVVLNRSLSSAQTNGYIEQNPAEGISVPVNAFAKHVDALTIEQQSNVIKKCYYDKYGVITIFYCILDYVHLNFET